MTDTVTIDLRDEQLLRAIGSMLAVMEQPSRLMREIGAVMERNAEQRFDSKTDPAGAAWRPLARNTIDHWYARKYPSGIPGSLLERTRLLRASLAYNSGDDWVEIGTSRSVPGKKQPTWQVGFLHEFGTAIMPRRGILTADPETGTLGERDVQDILGVISRALDDAIDNA
jgi:phage virion morphogenesis protein